MKKSSLLGHVARGLGAAAMVVAATSATAYADNPPTTPPGTGSSTGAGWLKGDPGQCVSGAAKKALAACPAGTLKQKSSGKKNGAAFIETDAPKGGEKKKQADKPVNIEIPRPTPELSKKIKTALMQEIVQLETQLKKTKVSNSNYVLLARRLAESYYELEHLEQDDVLDLQTKILKEKKANQSSAADETEQKKDMKLRDESQERVVQLYNLILDKVPGYSKRDEVLYYLAYEYEERKATDPNDKDQVKYERENKERALQTYLRLIKEAPKSKFVPAAYIAYGDMYFDDALNGKIEWKLPLEAYERVIQASDPPENKQWGYAQYKKGFIYWNLGQYKDAVVAFKKAIEFGVKYNDLPKAPQIADEARKELVPVYAEYGKADDAYSFFNPISGDKPGEKTRTIDLLEKLGEEYLARARPMEGKALFTQLKGLNPSNSCYYDTRIAEAVIQNNPKEKTAIRAQLALLTKGFITYRDNPASPADKKLACGNQTAWLLTEHAIAWEYEALGDLGCPPDPDKKAANPKARPGTCNKETIASSIDVFELILKNFKSFDGYKFNLKNPADMPTIPKIKYSYADLLYGQGMWEKCGPAFDEVVALDPNSDVAADAAFASVLCYQNVYDKQYKGKEKESSTGKGNISNKPKTVEDSLKVANTPKALDDYQAKMVGAFDRFVCYVKPDASSKSYADDVGKLTEIKYRRAFIYYEGRHWDEAGEAFHDVAMNYPDSDYGYLAAGFYLDSVVRIYNYADPPRENCGAQMSTDVDAMYGLYCDPAKVGARLKDKKRAEEFLDETRGQCDKLHAAKADLDAIAAKEMVDKGQFEAGADKFSQLATDVCTHVNADADEKPKPGPKPKTAPVEMNACEDRADVYLYNAASAYQKASKIKKAMDIREKKILTHDTWKTKETYRLTMFDLAEDYRRIALYSTAAKWYETFAATDANTSKLLELAEGKMLQEQKDHPDKYTGKSLQDVAKEYTEEQRASALSNAVVLRLGLGQEEDAIKDSDTFDKRFGSKRKDQARQIFLAIGEHYVEKEDWAKGATRLDKFIGQFSTEARLDEKLHARALAGRAYHQMKQDGKADTMFGTIRDDWSKNRDALRKQIESDADANKTLTKIRQNAYSAIAETYLYFADKDAVKAQSIKYEGYKGNGDYENIMKWITGKFVPYLQKRKDANEPAYRGYIKVFCLGEETCSRDWKDLAENFASKFVVEAASKAGDLYADTYDKALNAPLSNELIDSPSDPKSIKEAKADARASYLSQFDRAAEPIKAPARSAFMECLTLSTEAKFFDEYSERCEKWLATVYKGEFRTLEELRPVGGLVGTGLKDRAFLVDSKLVPFDVTTRK